MKTYYTEGELDGLKFEHGFITSYDYAGKFDDIEAITQALTVHGKLQSVSEVFFDGLAWAYGTTMSQPIFGVVNEANQTIYWTYLHGVKQLGAFNRTPTASDINKAAEIVRGYSES